MMTLAAFFLSVTGFAALALAMHKHHRDLTGTAPTPPRGLVLRIAGWGLLGGSLILVISVWGVSIGIVFWFGIATISVMAVAQMLTYRPDWLAIAVPPTAEQMAKLARCNPIGEVID